MSCNALVTLGPSGSCNPDDSNISKIFSCHQGLCELFPADSTTHLIFTTPSLPLMHTHWSFTVSWPLWSLAQPRDFALAVASTWMALSPWFATALLPNHIGNCPSLSAPVTLTHLTPLQSTCSDLPAILSVFLLLKRWFSQNKSLWKYNYIGNQWSKITSIGKAKF